MQCARGPTAAKPDDRGYACELYNALIVSMMFTETRGKTNRAHILVNSGVVETRGNVRISDIFVLRRIEAAIERRGRGRKCTGWGGEGKGAVNGGGGNALGEVCGGKEGG